MVSLKRNLFYSIIYNIIIIIVPLTTRPYLSRVLGVEGIGTFAYYNNISIYFILFAKLGLNIYGTRAIASIRDCKFKISKTFCSIYCLQAFTSIISIIIYFIYVLFISSETTISLIMGIYIISSIIDIAWFYQGLEKFKFIVYRDISFKLITVIFIFIFVKDRSDLYLYCFIYSFMNLMSNIILCIQLTKYINIVSVKFIDIYPHIRPNLILFIPVIAVSLYKIIDKIMLGIMSNKIEVGYYESSESIMMLPTIIVYSLGTIMIPRLSYLVSKQRSTEYIEKSLTIAIFLSSSMSFGIMGIAKEFVPFFFGSDFSKCIILFQILTPCTLFLAFVNVIKTQFLIPYNFDRKYIVLTLIGAVTNLLLNIILIPKLHSVGASISTFVAEFLVFISLCIMIRNKLKLTNYFIHILPFIISSIIMYILLFNFTIDGVSDFFIVSIKIMFGICIYFCVLIFIIYIYKFYFKEVLASYCEILNYILKR